MTRRILTVRTVPLSGVFILPPSRTNVSRSNNYLLVFKMKEGKVGRHLYWIHIGSCDIFIYL